MLSNRSRGRERGRGGGGRGAGGGVVGSWAEFGVEEMSQFSPSDKSICLRNE